MFELGPFTFTGGGLVAIALVVGLCASVVGCIVADSFWCPLVCVCEINGVVGVVRRSDYNKASRRYWRKHRFDTGALPDGRGRIISVSPTFTFKVVKGESNPRLQTLIKDCRVERACFAVEPFYPETAGLFADAWRHIHGPVAVRPNV
jgi:hypothetical protein